MKTLKLKFQDFEIKNNEINQKIKKEVWFVIYIDNMEEPISTNLFNIFEKEIFIIINLNNSFNNSNIYFNLCCYEENNIISIGKFKTNFNSLNLNGIYKNSLLFLSSNLPQKNIFSINLIGEFINFINNIKLQQIGANSYIF